MDADYEREIAVSLGTTQVLVVMLGMGVVSIYVIVGVLIVSDALGLTPARGFPLPAIGCLVALVLTGASFVIKSALMASVRNAAKSHSWTVLDLLARYRKATVVAAALCDGGAVALAVFVVAAGPGSLLWLAGGLLPLLGFALHFPTREKLDGFLVEYRSKGGSNASE